MMNHRICEWMYLWLMISEGWILMIDDCLADQIKIKIIQWYLIKHMAAKAFTCVS